MHEVPRGHRSITLAYSLSGGKGGQNVNKVNTKVQLFFEVDEADDYGRTALMYACMGKALDHNTTDSEVDCYEH